MQYLFLAMTNPIAGREAEFNDWYDRHHVPEVVTYGRGFLGGRRYRKESGGDNPHSWAYLAAYDFESDDLEAYHRAPWTRVPPPLTPFTGLLTDDHIAWIYRPVGPRHGRAGDSALRSPLRSSSPRLCFVWADPDQQEKPAFEQSQADYVQELLQAVPGLVGVQRYVSARHQRPGQARLPSWALAIYEVEHSDSIPTIQSHLAVKDTSVSRSLHGLTARETVSCFAPLSPYVVGDRAEAHSSLLQSDLPE